jgi:NADH dehydrogenase
MKICILGGSGFIGGHLLNQLSDSGVQSLVPTRNPGARSEARVAPGMVYKTTDIFDPAQLNESLQGCQAVINLVGILNESGRDGSGFERAHVGLVESVIEACQAQGVQRFLQLSSLNAGTGDSHYLRSKGDAELRLRQSTLDWTIFRPSVVFGPGDSFLNTFAYLLRLGRGFMPLACPDARMQPVYVADVAAALKHALLHPTETSEQVYELAGPQVYTLAELVRYTRDQLQLPGPVIGLPDSLSKLQAAMLQWIPGKPFSPDNYRSLQFDSVSDNNGLQQLGITATALEAVVPRYLGRNNRSDRHQKSRRLAGRDAS